MVDAKGFRAAGFQPIRRRYSAMRIPLSYADATVYSEGLGSEMEENGTKVGFNRASKQ